MSAIRRAVGPCLLACILAAWLLALGPTRFAGPAGYVIVSGRSMESTFYSGDLVITREKSSYDVGDVVAFRVPKEDEQAAGSLIIHRIVGGNGEQGFMVQGDNKAAPDTWRPRQSDVVGKQWIHIPGFGKYLGSLREPAYFAAMIAGMSMLCLFGTTKVKQTRRRRHMNGSASHDNQGAGRGRSAPTWAITALGLTATLMLGFGFLVVTVYTRPVDEIVPSSTVSYDHTSTFDYSVEVSPSTLYPSGKLGPFLAAAPAEGQEPSASAAVAPAEQVFFSKLTHGMDLGFDYALVSPATTDLHGEMIVQLEVKAVGNPGWTKTETLLEPFPFQGSMVNARVYLDLEPVKTLIEAIETETGHKAQGYELRVLPVVHVAGSLGAEIIDDVYAGLHHQVQHNGVFARRESEV